MRNLCAWNRVEGMAEVNPGTLVVYFVKVSSEEVYLFKKFKKYGAKSVL